MESIYNFVSSPLFIINTVICKNSFSFININISCCFAWICFI